MHIPERVRFGTSNDEKKSIEDSTSTPNRIVILAAAERAILADGNRQIESGNQTIESAANPPASAALCEIYRAVISDNFSSLDKNYSMKCSAADDSTRSNHERKPRHWRTEL